MRRDMEDMDNKGWIHINIKVPANPIKEGKTMWVWKYDILLCVLFTFQSNMHLLVYLLYYIPSFYFINRALDDNSRGPAY